jgi:hypothetical protein
MWRNHSIDIKTFATELFQDELIPTLVFPAWLTKASIKE